MAVRHHKEVIAMDDAQFEAWRKTKMKHLSQGKSLAAKRGAREKMRAYIKMRRAVQGEAEE